MKKRPSTFLLLEIIIALMLFSLCMVPLVRMPLYALSAEVKAYQRLQLHRLSDLSFAAVKARLYQRDISWEEVDVPKKNKTLVSHKTLALGLKGGGARKVQEDCYIWSSSHKTGKKQEQYRLLTVEVRFTTQQKNFFLFKKTRRGSLSFYYKVFVTQQDLPPAEL